MDIKKPDIRQKFRTFQCNGGVFGNNSNALRESDCERRERRAERAAGAAGKQARPTEAGSGSPRRDSAAKRNKTGGEKRMVVPEAKDFLSRLKYEVANEQGVNLKQGYNGDLTAKQNGTVGGYMVKKMIDQAMNMR